MAQQIAEQVIMTAVDPIVVTNDSGCVLQVNTATSRLFGYDAEEMIGENISILMGEPERSAHDSYLADYRRTGVRSIIGIGRDVEGRTKNGDAIAVHLSVSELIVNGVSLFAGIMQDIRVRHMLEEELERANALLAAELATARAELDVLTDRDRIARGLHDTVIQQLFAAGLGLNAASNLARSEGLADRLTNAVNQIDDSIYQLRSIVYDLHTRSRPTGLKRAVLAVVEEQTPALGFVPEVKVGVQISEVSDRVINELMPTLREGLSNIAQHAHARSAQVFLRLEDGELVLHLADDGLGVAPLEESLREHRPVRGNGLRNMNERADSVGGSCTLRSRPGGGAELVWRVPANA